jgi:hypothetical protein
VDLPSFTASASKVGLIHLLVGVYELIRLSVVIKIGVHFMNFTNTIKTYDQASHQFPMASLLYDFTF